MGPGTNHGRGILVITQDTEDWAQAPIYILSFTVPRLAGEYGRLPMTMELLGISAGLELLDAVSMTGTVYSDCQGPVRKLHHPADPCWPRLPSPTHPPLEETPMDS